MHTPTTAWSERSQELARLMARTGLGDRAAFSALYERTSAHLYAVILRINRDRAQAEDILQEVYVSVWRSASSFQGAQSQPLTWLVSIARHRAIDSLRRLQSQPQFSRAAESGDTDDDDARAMDDIPDNAPGPMELLSQAAEARALHHCMEELSAPQRQCLAFAFYDGLSHAEVAEKMGKPLGTVKSLVRRALQVLKGCLQAATLTDAARAPASSAAPAPSHAGRTRSGAD